MHSTGILCVAIIGKFKYRKYEAAGWCNHVAHIVQVGKVSGRSLLKRVRAFDGVMNSKEFPKEQWASMESANSQDYLIFGQGCGNELYAKRHVVKGMTEDVPVGLTPLLVNDDAEHFIVENAI